MTMRLAKGELLSHACYSPMTFVSFISFDTISTRKNWLRALLLVGAQLAKKVFFPLRHPIKVHDMYTCSPFKTHVGITGTALSGRPPYIAHVVTSRAPRAQGSLLQVFRNRRRLPARQQQKWECLRVASRKEQKFLRRNARSAIHVREFYPLSLTPANSWTNSSTSACDPRHNGI